MTTALDFVRRAIERDLAADQSDRVYVHNLRVTLEEEAELALREQDREAHRRCEEAADAFVTCGLARPRVESWRQVPSFTLLDYICPGCGGLTDGLDDPRVPCCPKCCGAGRGGCMCDHDCDSLCIDSCPRWLQARAAERRT